MANADEAQYVNFDFTENNKDDLFNFLNDSAITNGFHDDETESINTSLKSIHSNGSPKNDNGTATTMESVSVVPEHQIDNSDTDSLQLKGGHQLLEESGTETSKANLFTVNDKSQTTVTSGKQPANMAASVISLSNGSGTAKARAAKSPYSSSSAASIPEEAISIPNDSNISSFTCDQLANFLRCFNVDKKIISHLYRKNVDGKRFSRLRDSELENLGMKNPVIVFFRDRSTVKPANKKQLWVL